MKLTAISFFLIILCLQAVSALDFSWNYPSSVKVGDAFDVSLSASTSENYDVKIFVQDNSTGAIISEIYNDGWKNPYYYIKSVFPAISEFSARVKNYSANAAICARLRKIGSSSYSEKCGSINIEKSSSASEKEPEESPPAESSNSDFIPSTEVSTASQAISEPEQASSDKIYLSSKKPASTSFVTTEEKTRLYAVYAFTALAVLALILLAFKKL